MKPPPHRHLAAVAVSLLAVGLAGAGCLQGETVLDPESDTSAGGSSAITPVDGSGRGGVGAPSGSGGSAGARDAGVQAQAGRGGGGAVATGGVAGNASGAGGIRAVDAGAGGRGGAGGAAGAGRGGSTGAMTCAAGTHLCGTTCASDMSINSCGTSCSPCMAPAGGTATCDGRQCGIDCGGQRRCGSLCVAASGCCADADCAPRTGQQARCDLQMHACTYQGAAGGTTLFGFDSGIAPWTLYMTSPERLASGTSLAFSAQGGDVTPGALKVQAPFDAGNQKVEFQAGLATPLDARGHTLRARVRLVSGLSDDTAHPGAIKMFAKAGAQYDYASGVWTNLTGSQWADVTLNPAAPDLVAGGTFSPMDVRQLGFELRVFSDTQRPTAAVILIDTVSVQ